MSEQTDNPTLPAAPHEVAAAPRSPLAGPVAGAGLLVFMAVAVVSIASGLFSGTLALRPADASAEAVLDGTASREVADHLADASVASWAARLQRGLGWITLRDLGPQVRQGCPGWLFLASELTVHRHAEDNALARARSVAQVHRALAERGIDLLVAVVPDKTRIEADRLCGLERPAALAGRTAGWAAALAGLGVTAVDLAPALQSVQPDAFLRTDTHWTQAGAGAAANMLAERVRDSGVALQPPQSYEVRPQPPQPRPGDLVRLAGLDWLPAALQPETETVREDAYVVRRDTAAAGANDLFGDAHLPGIVVIGTSFSRTSDFVPQLSQALGAAVGNFGKDGGEFSGGAQAYFASPAYKQTPPRLVIWEIPERDLQPPLKPGDTAVMP